MHISFQREDLLKPLSYVSGVVERRQTLPILSYVLLRHNDKETTLTGTDLEIEILAKATASSKTSGELTLPARKLLDICRALPSDAVLDIRKEGEKVVVKAGKSRFSLVTLPVNEFPNLEVTNWDIVFSLPQQDLKKALEQTQFCMAQQDVRYYLNGLLLEIKDNKLRLVATDGHRMAMTEVSLDKAPKGERQAIIPRKAIHEISRLLSDTSESVELRLSANHLRADTGELIFTSKLIDGRYPDYTKVLPASLTRYAVLEREAFREALARTAILSNEKYRGVRLGFNNAALKISAHNPEQEEAQEEIAADYQGEAMEIGFNVNYLTEAVSALAGAQVKLGLNDPNSSCLITLPEARYPQYVVMPMRL
jgi:DNA polymerase-3 subunit beta